MADQWLIRSAENRISGPFTRQQICDLILQGKLYANDEVCHANVYWFYLHEHEEIRSQLGLELPKELYPKAEEPTQTATDTQLSESTDPEIETEQTRVAAMGVAVSAPAGVRPSNAQANAQASAMLSRPEVRGGMSVEKPKILQFFVSLMMIGALVLLFLLIRLLRNQPF